MNVVYSRAVVKGLMYINPFQKEGAIAILNTAETAYGNFSFHEGPENNKWRGDRFEAEIRRAIVLAETAEKIKY